MFRLSKTTLCVSLALALLLLVGHTSPARAITYGDPVGDAVGLYPEVISVWEEDLDGDLKPTCTATLIEQQVAITAAHCVQSASSDLYVEVGAQILGEGRTIPVVSSWYNPRYSSSRIANDVAVLYLGQPANVANVATLKKLKTFTSKTKLNIAGWGVDQNGDYQSQLHQLNVRYDITRAKRWYGSSFNKRTTVAAGRWFNVEKVYGGACYGDSGGPLFSGRSGGQRNLVGIVSYGVRGCDESAPTVFARVDYYWAKIQEGIAATRAEAVRIQLQIDSSPLTASISVSRPYSVLNYWDVVAVASTYSGAYIAQWCFQIDGRSAASSEIYYGSGGFPFSEGADGCFTPSYLSDLKSGSVQFRLDSLAPGAHTIAATVTDSLGRSFAVPAVAFTK